jgi:hypothetical protein
MPAWRTGTSVRRVLVPSPTSEAAMMKPIFISILMLLAACGLDNKQPTKPAAVDQEPLESALIVGSAESPDPVLARVIALEQSGVVKDVVVQESFPVQIRLRAPRRVIDELNRMPRTGQLR